MEENIEKKEIKTEENIEKKEIKTEENIEKKDTVPTPASVSAPISTKTNMPAVKVDTGVVKGNLVAVLAYLGGILSAILILFLEKDNKFVRFHAMQSIAIFLSILVISMIVIVIPFIGWMISPLIWLLGILIYLFMMYKAYNGEIYRLPAIGDFVTKQVGI